MPERRNHERHVVFVAAEIERGPKLRLGITKDLSRSGALLFTRTRLRVGDDIVLKLVMSDQGREQVVARVIREDDVAVDGFWRRQVAVTFDRLLPENTAQRIGEVAAMQAVELGG